jgi:hypothetical protein
MLSRTDTMRTIPRLVIDSLLDRARINCAVGDQFIRASRSKSSSASSGVIHLSNATPQEHAIVTR